MNLREQGKERRRQRILDAVVDLLQADGMTALSTARIAEAAEVSVATLYNLIGSVDEILDALMERQVREFEASRGEPVSSASGAGSAGGPAR